MALKDWKKTADQKDYIVWRNDKKSKQVAVYRGIFMVLNLKSGINRNYRKGNMVSAIKSAKAYMKKY